jgi:hypothetical protein
MRQQPKQCSKCGGRMIDGFLLDATESGHKAAKWVEGEPKKSFWLGLKLRGTRQIEIATWRCERCGYLESYAPS